MTHSRLTTGEQIESVWALGGLAWKELANRVWQKIQQDDLINRGYELAYNFLFAVFPMLLFLIALFGLFASAGAALRSGLFFYMQRILPPAAYDLVTKTASEIIQNSGGGKLTFGLALAVYSGSSGMTQLISNLNNAYEIREQRSWVKVHLISLSLTLVISVLVIAALLLILGGGQVANYLGDILSLSHLVVRGWKVFQWALSLGIIILAFALIYYFAPDVDEQHWYWITPGSVVGVVLWFAASGVLRIYLHYFDSYSETYGSLGAVIVLLLWFYITGLAFLIGGVVNSAIEHAAAERGHPEAKAEGQKAPQSDPFPKVSLLDT
jgi:membrane protein